MVTISVCMIVKNEEDKLTACLDGLKSIADEIIIVDTGSSDDTKKIAAKYTDKIYDYKWTGSFADARNYAFGLATCDYIYSADADETLDEKNTAAFGRLKEVLDERVDIVQMYYCNQLSNNTIYNFDKELRPKLYKRVRGFVWEEAIHEAVRLDPVVINCDIEIIHNPSEGHAARDLHAFEQMVSENPQNISDRLIDIYAKELYIAGKKENFIAAGKLFGPLCDKDEISEELLTVALAVAAKAARYRGDIAGFMKYAMRAAAGNLMCSELCYEIADYYMSVGDVKEAHLWYYNAANEVIPSMNIKYQDELPNEAIKKCEQMLGL